MTKRHWARIAAYGLGFALTVSSASAQGGGVNLEKYVALGDSLTAGFSRGGLSIEQQADSYPALLHDAFQAAGGASGEFEQPLVSAPGLPAQLQLVGLTPVLITARSGEGQPINLSLARPYDNLGVPGARVHDTANTVTDGGGAHDLVLRGLGSALAQALAQDPTLVTVQIGNNDVLGPATSGLAAGGPPLLPVASFEADMRFLVGTIASSDAQIAIANLPNVTAIPFFTTIPPVVVNPSTGQPVLVNGEPVPLLGPDGPLGPDDLVLLTASSLLAQGIGIPGAIPGGSGLPLPDQVVLDAEETAQVLARVSEFNDVIRALAEEHRAALVDVNAVFDGIVADGLTLGGIDFSADYLTGGLFSYDGVHPTRLGYGVLANAFIEAINRVFGAAIPLVDLERLAFEPPSTSGATTVAVRASSAGNRWTPFVYKRKAWRNLQYALGLKSLKAEAPGQPEPPESPDRPDRIRRHPAPQQAPAAASRITRPRG